MDHSITVVYEINMTVSAEYKWPVLKPSFILPKELLVPLIG